MLSTEYKVRLVLVHLVLHLSTVHKWCSMTASTHVSAPLSHSAPRSHLRGCSPTLFSIFSKLGCLETPHSVLRGHPTETAGA